MNILIHPTYFPNIAHFTAMTQANEVTFEADDNFLKQTYRNRTYICAANGKLLLNIPVIHSQKNRQKYRDVKISKDTNWQSLHWKSLLSAYSTSPFFEFYKDELEPLFKIKTDFIFDFNLKCIETIFECIQLNVSTTKTDVFEKTVKNKKDFRYLVNAKIDEPEFAPYNQVFGDKHGFLNNLSILDLLFNEGPNTLGYLESQLITNL